MTIIDEHCCYIQRDGSTCPRKASWVIWAVPEPFQGSFTTACSRHIAQLLTVAYEHRIYPIGSMVGEGLDNPCKLL